MGRTEPRCGRIWPAGRCLPAPVLCHAKFFLRLHTHCLINEKRAQNSTSATKKVKRKEIEHLIVEYMKEESYFTLSRSNIIIAYAPWSGCYNYLFFALLCSYISISLLYLTYSDNYFRYGYLGLVRHFNFKTDNSIGFDRIMGHLHGQTLSNSENFDNRLRQILRMHVG